MVIYNSSLSRLLPALIPNTRLNFMEPSGGMVKDVQDNVGKRREKEVFYWYWYVYYLFVYLDCKKMKDCCRMTVWVY